ncbi:MAG: FAD-linked oxidase C-terminal domain-containing protein [Patescibacteria group bacterium]
MLSKQKIEEFKKEFEGDILTQRFWREIYSTDASLYKFVPELIVLPKTKNDIQQTVKFAKENQIGITCRTAGTSVAGTAVGPGIIMDFTRYFDQVLEISPSTALGAGFVRTQPGVIYDDLQAKLAEKGLFLPPVPASSRACMIGGNVATKACGGGAVKYGTLDDFMLAIEFVDADGDIVNTETGAGVEKFKTKLETLRTKILNDKKSMAIMNRKADVQNASVYNISAFDKYADTNELIAHLMMGSIGTLGIFTEIKLKVIPKPTEKPVSWAVFLSDLYQIDNFIKEVKRLGCSGVELVDKVSLELASSCFPMLGLSKEAEAMFIVQFDEKIEATLKEFENSLKNFSLVGEVIKDADKMGKIWELRKCLLPLTAKFSPTTKPLVSIDDVGVRIKDIPDLLKDLRKIFKDLDIQVALYGHAGTGTIHIDPVIEASTTKHIKTIKKIADRVYSAVFKYDGTTATEHGGGRCRSMYMKKEWGGKIVKYLKEIKNIFDKDDILNPSTMFSKDKIYDNIKLPMKPLGNEEWPCMECAYCQNKCPAWITSKKGETGPKQFKNLIRYKLLAPNLVEGETEEIEEQIRKCVLCGMCTKTCDTIVGAKLKEFNESYREGKLK